MDALAESRDQYLQVEGRPEKSLIRHRELLAVVKEGDKELAADIMREHLEDIEISVFGVKRKEEPTKPD